MKVKEEFVLRKFMGTWVVMAVGEETKNFHHMLTLNDTGVMLWNLLSDETDREYLADALVAEYGIDQTIALTDVDDFLEAIRKIGCLE